MEENKLNLYLFWYKATSLSPTEYVQVVAYTYEQACKYFNDYIKYSVGRVYDYDPTPCKVCEGYNFVQKHEVGEIWGCNAIL